MSVPKEEWCVIQVRTLEFIKKDYQRFIDHGGGASNKAKLFHNVINKPLLQCETDQVKKCLMQIYMYDNKIMNYKEP